MDPDTANQDTNVSSANASAIDLVDSMSNMKLSEDKNTEHPARTLVIYLRPQILKLSKSPLVKPPCGMPSLKEWFGSDEQNMHKKEGEGSPTSARDKRPRRDPEDGEPARPLRLPQPSQMGNFKHQSFRSTDRNDRDKDGDKERERDIRDKEGQEKLRNLSDKYDRDRLAHHSNSTHLRTKERETAPHLGAASSRVSTRDGPLNAAQRRPEPREGAKKRTIEASEDWRRGGDHIRTGREDRPDNSRRDRDDRDRPRSRARDSSRPRRERSTSRRDRDRDERDRDRDRRGDRDRDEYRRGDDYRRERDDYRRDFDKDVDGEDSRRWRDDGKRDERMAARRDRERVRDRPPREEGWESSNRWTVVEDRDSRTKRSSGRDRRSGVLDDGKEKDDRKERDRDRDREQREREKEKEPAWMDTYIPTGPGAGILGGKGGEGELDGIQAFKKGMKAKEQKDLPSSGEMLERADVDGPNGSSKIAAPSSTLLSEKPLDEIQLFKLMMKKEQEQKMPQKLQTSVTEPTLTGPSLQEIENGGLSGIRDNRVISTPSNGGPGTPSVSEPQSALEQPTSAVLPKGTSTPTPPAHNITSDPPKNLLSILSPSNANGTRLSSLTTTIPITSVDSTLPKSSGSRFFPKPLSSDVPSPVPSDQGSSSQAPPQFNPPAGSRLLAFGARNAPAGPGLPNSNQSSLHSLHGLHPSLQQHGPQLTSDAFQNPGTSLAQSSDVNQRPIMSEAIRTQQGFSPFELQSRSAFALDDSRDVGQFGHNTDSLRRGSLVSPADRAPFSMNSDSGSTYSNMSGSHVNANPEAFPVNGPNPPFDSINNGIPYGSGKGSRFLKYFEDKGRDGQAAGIRKPQGPIGFQSSSPNPGQRQDQINFNGGHVDTRTVDELVAMLSTSQSQRVTSVNQMGSGPAPSGSHFGQNSGLQSLHHQQVHGQQHLPPNSRLDSLYESRLDDRNFVPDGMVPGLRQAPPPRSRENNGMFTDPLDDSMSFNPHRPPQQRVLDHNMYPGAGPSMYAQQSGGGRHAGIPLQPPQFRGNPSPNPLQAPAQQRLPPGLANLGGRPPHEPSQFLGSSIGMQQSGGIHGPLHGNGPSPQSFNNFGPGTGLGGYGSNPQMRGPPIGAHQLPNAMGPNQMGHPGGMELRGPSNQAQLLNLGGGPNIGGVLRGAGGGFLSQQGPPMQAPLMAMRQQQQQQQHVPPHMMPPQSHHLPPHMQQQSLSGPAQDLMALLMGNGPHRE